MKKIVLLILILILIFGVLGIKKRKSEENSREEILSAYSLPKNTVEVLHHKKTYWVSFFQVNNLDNLFLYPNFIKKTSSTVLREEKNCHDFINGGFYTTDDKPLGLFIFEGNLLRVRTYHLLIPAFFYIDYQKIAGISYLLPRRDLRIALQSGPLLVNQGKKTKLSMRKDKSARRSVVLITDNHELYFLSVYDPENVNSGPYLVNLSDILLKASVKIGFLIDSALNLDGGTASAFYSEFVSLPELVFIGSYFCHSLP